MSDAEGAPIGGAQDDNTRAYLVIVDDEVRHRHECIKVATGYMLALIDAGEEPELARMVSRPAGTSGA